MKTIYFVAGEASADNHGAALMRALRVLDPNLRFIGRGGPKMKAVAGDQFRNWIDQAGVLGLWEVIKQYGYFRKQFHQALREIEMNQPDAVLLIDYPGFNLRLARVLQERSLARKIIYYISPQVWAWNRGRIKKMAQWIDLMLCIFPFEADLYNQSGLRTIFVGHPMIERLRAEKISVERDKKLIGLFPGSRSREVKKIMPILIEAARELVRRDPGVRFEVAAASLKMAQEIAQVVDSYPHGGGIAPAPLPEGQEIARRAWTGPHQARVGPDTDNHLVFEIKVGETNQMMQRAFAGIVASGSATLEAAYFRLPFVLVYKVSWITYLVGRLVVKVNYLGMPNVLANREVVPEFIQHEAKPKEIATTVQRLIDDQAARQEMISSFDAIIDSLGQGGASERAAAAILDALP